MDRSFSSFEEIDTRLEILRLQRQISLERLRVQFRESPGRILKDTWMNSVRPALTDMVIGWALYRLREARKRLRPELERLD